MKLIVGLGNPGEKYQSTRHNLGFMVVEHFLKDFSTEKNTQWENSGKFKSDIAEIDWQPKAGSLQKVILVKPKTFMNNSGLAVSLISRFYKIAANDIWVIHDDLDLPLGSMKIRLGGGAAGHHGVESIMESLGTEKFWRFRMGIGTSRHHDEMAKHKVKGDDIVLKSFGKGESGEIREAIKKATKAISLALEKDLESAMNRFNTK